MTAVFLVVGVLALVAIAYGVVAGRRNAALVQAVHLRVLGEDDLRALSDEINRLGLAPEAAGERATALECESRAQNLLAGARRPADLVAVSKAIADAHHAVACGHARVDGREPPAERPLCLFNPAHGRSTRDVSWTPPGLDLRHVPACAACASAAEHGLEPTARTVRVDGRSLPYWDAPDWYGAWAAGYFGSSGALFAGLPISR